MGLARRFFDQILPPYVTCHIPLPRTALAPTSRVLISAPSPGCRLSDWELVQRATTLSCFLDRLLTQVRTSICRLTNRYDATEPTSERHIIHVSLYPRTALRTLIHPTLHKSTMFTANPVMPDLQENPRRASSPEIRLGWPFCRATRNSNGQGLQPHTSIAIPASDHPSPPCGQISVRD